MSKQPFPANAPVVVFTGTREPPLSWRERIHDVVDALASNTVVVTGACVGVDALVARMAYRRGDLWVHTIVPTYRGAWFDADWGKHCDSHILMPPGTTLPDRDRRMVAMAFGHGGRVVAIPRHPERDPLSRRSGTWLTVREAGRRGVPVEIVAFYDAPVEVTR